MRYPRRPFYLLALAVLLVLGEEALAQVMIRADVATSIFGDPTVKKAGVALAFVLSRVLAIGVAPGLVLAAIASLVGAHFSSSGASISVAEGTGVDR